MSIDVAYLRAVQFRRMACAIPMMSFIGNLAGVTTQAAFVESMIVVFAGGKTGLSAVVAGASCGPYRLRLDCRSVTAGDM